MSKILTWACWNAALISSIYCGMWLHNPGANNIALFLIWLAIVISFGLNIKAVILEQAKGKRGFGIPAWIDVPIDIGILLAIVYSGYIVTGVFWVMHTLNGINFRNKVNELRKTLTV